MKIYNFKCIVEGGWIIEASWILNGTYRCKIKLLKSGKMLALSCNHKYHKPDVPCSDYGGYAGSDAMVLIRWHATKIEMWAVLSKNEEYIWA